MKKLFMFAAFLLAVTISPTALAANWVHVATYDEHSIHYDYYVDKDSIKRATNSKFSQPNAVLAVVKTVWRSKTSNGVREGNSDSIVGFWTEDGKKYFAYLTGYLNGSDMVYNGMVANHGWEIVWDYVHNNLP